jgi:hypothetical protein
MKIRHSAVTSPVYELVRVVETDIQFGDHAWTYRIELLRNTEDETRFRCHVWETEMFRLMPSFPRDDKDEPAHVSDDTLMVERPIPRSQVEYPSEDIVALDADAALEIVLADLRRFLEHSTGEAAR